MPPAYDATELLTEGQRRHLAASLRQVGSALAEIERLARPGVPPARNPLDNRVMDLPAAFAQAIASDLTGAHVELRDLVAALGLRSSPLTAARTVQALVVSSMVVLEDAGSRAMVGYGDVDPRLPLILDPALDRLHERMSAIGDHLAELSR